jgi:hypothetical protein
MLNKKLKIGTGTMTSRVNNKYLISEFDGAIELFVTDKKLVSLKANYQFNSSDSYEISLTFPADLKGRHDFNEEFTSPFWFSHSDPFITKSYKSIPAAGFIDIQKLDLVEGTLEATFNFSFEDFDTKKTHQVHDGQLKAQGLVIVP